MGVMADSRIYDCASVGSCLSSGYRQKHFPAAHRHILGETVAEKPNKDPKAPHPLDPLAVCDLQLDLH